MLTDEVYEKLGAIIKSRREAIHMTQEDLAKRVSLSRSSVANIEKGRQKFLFHQLYDFSDALNINVEDLLPALDSSLLESRLEKAEISSVLRDNIKHAIEKAKHG